MRTIGMKALIGMGIERTKVILFRPFVFKKWLKLLFIAVLAGAVSFSFSMPESQQENPPLKDKNPFDMHESIQPSSLGRSFSFSGLLAPWRGLVNSAGWSDSLSRGAGTCPLFQPIGALIALAVTLLVSLIVLFVWLSSRFKFVWLHALITDQVAVKEPFRTFRAQGNALFCFLLIFISLFLIVFALFAWWGYSIVSASGILQKEAPAIFFEGLKVLALPLTLFIAFVISSIVVGISIEHFIVTIMALDTCGFKSAWGKFAAIVKKNLREFFVYVLVLLLLGIGTSILVMLVSLVCLLAVLLAGAVVFGIPYYLLHVLFKAPVAFIAVAIIAGIPFVIAALFLFLSAQLPFAVFLRCFSFYFLSSLNCGYTPLPLVIASRKDAPLP
jgi:hypothetical protein